METHSNTMDSIHTRFPTAFPVKDEVLTIGQAFERIQTYVSNNIRSISIDFTTNNPIACKASKITDAICEYLHMTRKNSDAGIIVMALREMIDLGWKLPMYDHPEYIPPRYLVNGEFKLHIPANECKAYIEFINGSQTERRTIFFMKQVCIYIIVYPEFYQLMELDADNATEKDLVAMINNPLFRLFMCPYFGVYKYNKFIAQQKRVFNHVFTFPEITLDGLC